MNRLLLLALLFLPQDENPIDKLKALTPEKAATEGRPLLLTTLELETHGAMRAMEMGKLDEAEMRLLRVAHLSRPYCPEHAQRVTQVLLRLRQEARADGIALVKAVSDDVRMGRFDAATKRIDTAIADTLIGRAYKTDIERMKAWLKGPFVPAMADMEIAKWKKASPGGAKSACAPCLGGGEIDCPSCVTGMVAQSCRTCAGKGQGACILCDGKGTVVHGGYKGRLRLTLENDVTIKVVLKNGKNAQMRLHAQTLTWVAGSCDGKGTFTLNASSMPKNPAQPASAPVTVQIECGDFFKELRNFVFSGRAKIAEGGDDPSKTRDLSVEAAKRLFGEYDKCKSGRVPCDQCAGKTVSPCVPCGGKGMRLAPCSECSGSESKACDTCFMSGDSAWLAKLVPLESVRDLADGLKIHADQLSAWQERRTKQVAHQQQLTARYEDLRKGLEPSAKVEPGFVNIPCGACKGKGATCEECWGTGRREYLDGTPQYDRYHAAARVAKQLAELSKGARGLSYPPLVIRADDPRAASPEPGPAGPPVTNDFGYTPGLPPPSKTPPPGTDPTPAPAPAPLPSPTAAPSPSPSPVPAPPPVKSGVGSGVGGQIATLPADLQEMVRKGTEAYEAGKASLAKAKASENTDTWAAESRAAVAKFREAQAAFTTVQETLDEKGLDIPRELLDLIRNNMQALVMARKQAP